MVDVLKLDGSRLFNALHEVASFRQLLLGHDRSENMALGEPGIRDVERATDWIADTCKLLGAQTAVRESVYLRDYMRKLLEQLEDVDGFVDQRAATIASHDLGGLKSTCDRLNALVEDALVNQLLYVVDHRRAGLLEPSVPHFGDDVDRAYPSSAFDIAEAGKCLALDRPTASVMHMMRALEVPMSLLYKNLIGTEPDRAAWGGLLNEIRDKVNKLPDADARKQPCSEAAAQFRLYKNAWRDEAMHARTKYTEEEAHAVLGAVKATMQSLTGLLRE